MKIIFMIGAGSFIGGISRYLVSLFVQSKFVHAFPYGTLAVNIIGCFLIGIVFGLSEKGTMNTEWRLFLATGILGGFTTFSAFSFETINLMRNQEMINAIIYIIASILLGLLATLVGLWLCKVV